MEQEEDVDEETAEFIPIDSIDVTGDEDEDVTGDEEQLLSSPFTSPKRESGSQKQEKKTSITPILSKLRLLLYTVEFPAKDHLETDLFWIRFGLCFAEKKTTETVEQPSDDAVSWKDKIPGESVLYYQHHSFVIKMSFYQVYDDPILHANGGAK